MANATSRVQTVTTPYTDNIIKRNAMIPASNSTVFWSGIMTALQLNGAATGLVVMDDSQAGILFDGLVADGAEAIEVYSTDTLGDKIIDVERPYRFRMAIASAAEGDEGKPLYAVYDNQVGYSSVNSNLVGYVDAVINSTTVEIKPAFGGEPAPNTGFSGTVLTFTGTSGNNKIAMPNSEADALSIAQGSNEYLTFNTSTAGIVAKVPVTITSNGAAALVNGANGATNPVLQINAATSSVATGLKLTGAAAAGGVALLVTTSGTNENLTMDTAGSGTISFNSVSGTGNILFGQSALVNVAGKGLGFGTGAGGTVTQITSRTTGVTLSKMTGQITLVSAAGSATPFKMTVTNTLVAATDTIIANVATATDAYSVVVSAVAAGSYQLTITDLTGTTTETPVINVNVLKGVSA